MQGQNGTYKWHLDANLFGAACLWVNEYNLGSHSPNGYSINIDTTHKAWRQCLVSNAVYDYVTYVRNEGLTLPPNNLRIAVGNNNYGSSACYRQKKMCLTYMSYIHKIPTYNSLITNYSNMYFDLKNIGVSDKQLEKSLSISNSINSFKTNLLKVVDDTNLKNLVNQKFNKYE